MKWKSPNKLAVLRTVDAVVHQGNSPEDERLNVCISLWNQKMSSSEPAELSGTQRRLWSHGLQEGSPLEAEWFNYAHERGNWGADKWQGDPGLMSQNLNADTNSCRVEDLDRINGVLSAEKQKEIHIHDAIPAETCLIGPQRRNYCHWEQSCVKKGDLEVMIHF